MQQRRHAHADCRSDGDEYHGDGDEYQLCVWIHSDRTRILADCLAAASEEPSSAAAPIAAALAVAPAALAVAPAALAIAPAPALATWSVSPDP